MMDMHCHIDLYKDYERVLAKASESKCYVLSVTTTPSAWTKTNKICSKYPRVRTALGLHPQLAHERHLELDLFDRLAGRTRYIGEIGLDGSKEYREHLNIQLKVFRHILKVCSNFRDKILSIHSRGAVDQVLDNLEELNVNSVPILHWFTGTEKQLVRAIKQGCWFSIGPSMLKSKRSRDLIMLMPRDRVLLETDGPFGTYNGQILEPSDVYHMSLYLAGAWGVSEDSIGAQLTSNLKTILRENEVSRS